MNIQENVAYSNSASRFLAQEITETILDNTLCKAPRLAFAAKTGVSLTLPLIDRTNSSKVITIEEGNICVAGTKEQRISLIANIQESAHQEQKPSVKSGNQFLKSLSKPDRRKNRQTIVEVDLGKISPDSLGQIVSQCNTSFLFQVEELVMYCAFSEKYRITGRGSSLLKALGGEYLTRLHFMASLKEKEFMVIQGKKETIRVLT